MNCEDCGTSKTAKLCINPYTLDQNNEVVLCDDCFEDRTEQLIYG